MSISRQVAIPLDEIRFEAIRAQGAGGQNVNKVSSAIHLRFDINRSSLPEFYKQRLLQRRDRRISSDGIIVIKAQRFRSQDKNRADALERLRDLIRTAGEKTKPRKPTRPSKAVRARRVDRKVRHGRQKALRRRLDD